MEGVVGLGADTSVVEVGTLVVLATSAMACCPWLAARSICLAKVRCWAIRFSAKSDRKSVV